MVTVLHVLLKQNVVVGMERKERMKWVIPFVRNVGKILIRIFFSHSDPCKPRLLVNNIQEIFFSHSDPCKPRTR
ncbi:TNF-alpha-receptor-like protein [Cowpox virus]|uniref:TNF-alpha-receptor-like protein n=1 Tax=Cowpox virus TaxID=10243 RepID=G0XXE6_COWPX|nr:TNF-alpha-receptor-like protein [Cowpox virus]